MLTKSDIKNKLSVEVSVSAPMATALLQWSNMYINQSEWLRDTVKSMNLPAAISSEIARAVTIEMEVVVSSGDGTEKAPDKTGAEAPIAVKKISNRASYLDQQIEAVVPKLRQQIEYGVAKGGLMLKPYIAGENICVDFVQADQFYPVKFDVNGKITACVFSDQRVVGDKWYTRLEYHNMTDKGCEIQNQAFKSTGKDTLGSACPLTEIDDWKDLKPQATIVGIKKPLFAYFRFPVANTIDPTSPLGVSCYARAVDLIKEADTQWSRLIWEFSSGERALYVDELAFGRDKDGKPILPIKKLYRTLSVSGDLSENLFEDWSPTLREVNFLNGLEAILRKIEFNCGLAYGTLSNPQTVDKTATEIKISQQRSYATITDTQKSLEETLEELLYAMDMWATLGNLAPAGAYVATYTFDDSVIVDSEAQMLQDRQTVTMGAMPKWKFLERNYGLSEEEAKLWVQDNMDEQPEDIFAIPGEGVKKLPPKKGEKDGMKKEKE